MEKNQKVDYASAGVNLKAADNALDRIKKLAKGTFNASVLSEIGTFGGLFCPDFGGISAPVLVASTDGVGTKLKLAFMSGIHDTVGQDLVNHCVNDILVMGARPLFFMDYIGVGKLDPKVVEDIVSGLAKACKENNMPLLGGEMAELPGFYNDGEYDLAGNIIGLVDRDKIIDGSSIREGDIVLGLPSAGLHTNGYSLARKICFEIAGLKFKNQIDMFGNEIGLELMKVHKSYLHPVMKLLDQLRPVGMAHITGGGIGGNLIRIIPKGFKAVIKKDSWPRLPIFDYLMETGRVAEADMYDAFNMGIGYMIVVRPFDVDATEKILTKSGETVYRIGEITKGNKTVDLV